MRGYGNAERKSDDAIVDREGAAGGKKRTKENSSTGFPREASGEGMKVMAGRGPL